MIRVLVVDDDFMVVGLHAGVVAAQPGFEVAGVASTGAQALDLLQTARPDLVLLDIYLPDMTGLEVLRRVRHGSPVRAGGVAGPDVIVLSAARDADALRQARHAGVVQYLVKPFEVETLRDRLREYAVYRDTVEGVAEAEQDDVDRIFCTVPRARVTTPKGISTETIDLVLAALREATHDLSASECADAIGVSRSSARRYLEHLVAVGRAQVRHRYGGTGRPERRYSPR